MDPTTKPEIAKEAKETNEDVEVKKESLIKPIDLSSTTAASFASKRDLPTALDAERSILACILVDPNAIELAGYENLKSDDFYLEKHRIIFRAMQRLHATDKPINSVSLIDILQKETPGFSAENLKGIMDLEAYSYASKSVPLFSNIIKDKANLRRLIAASAEINRLAYQSGINASEIIDSAEETILEVRNNFTSAGAVDLASLVTHVMSKLENLFKSPGQITGVSSGFKGLDSLTNGFQPGELIIIAGRPSMGKTAFTLNVAAHAAIKNKTPVAFFSLEMSAEQLIHRLIGSEARIDLSLLRTGAIPTSQFAQLVGASGLVGQAQLYIDETPSISIGEMRSRCRRYVQKHKAEIIIIDYLQLMSSPENYENKATEVGEISKGLKSIARELKVPVIALSQLNRSVESRTDKRPMMSDLRESGAIEQDADVIAFLYREEYYLRDKTPDDKIGVAEVIISKNRNGPTGAIELKFFNNITRFVDLDRHHESFEA